MVHNNNGITDTHRITYLQNSVSWKAKQIIESYSCNPAYYETALNELMNHFGDPSVVVSAFINQLESWHDTDSNNKKSFVAFSNFLKRLVQTFEYLGFQADLQSSTLLKKAKEKVPYNILLKWTEHRLTTTAEPASLRSFQQLLELHAQIYDTINRDQTFTSFRQQQNNVDYLEDFSVLMAHYKPSSQINNQNLFGKDNSNAVLQPAIKPQITTSNREWSSSVTISNNAKANGKLQNNRHCPHCNNTIFWQLVPTTKSNHHKIDIKSLSKRNCARIVWAIITSDKIAFHKRTATADIILLYTTLQNKWNDRQQHSPQDLLHLVLHSIHQMKCHQAKTTNNTVDNLLVKRRSQILRGVTSILLQIIKASALIKSRLLRETGLNN